VVPYNPITLRSRSVLTVTAGPPSTGTFFSTISVAAALQKDPYSSIKILLVISVA
jgi:hypothetical protein